MANYQRCTQPVGYQRNCRCSPRVGHSFATETSTRRSVEDRSASTSLQHGLEDKDSDRIPSLRAQRQQPTHRGVHAAGQHQSGTEDL